MITYNEIEVLTIRIMSVKDQSIKKTKRYNKLFRNIPLKDTCNIKY